MQISMCKKIENNSSISFNKTYRPQIINLFEDLSSYNYKIDYCKLKEYGFIETNNKYVFSKQINNLIFKIRIENRNISLEIFDNDFNDECINYEIASIKEKWLEIINDIKNKCFIYTKYDNEQAMIIDKYILKNIMLEQNLCLINFQILVYIKTIKNGFALLWILIILRLIRTRKE